MIKPNDQSGFTIIELLLAMSFFTFILLFVITGFVQINRSYTRGITQKNVQNGTRTVFDDISRTIRSANSGDIIFINDSNNYRLCVGSIRYGFNQQIGADTETESISDETFSGTSEPLTIARTINPSSNCTDRISRSEEHTRTLLDDNLMVQHLQVERIGTSNSFHLELVVTTETLTDFGLYGKDAKCLVATGDEFCYVAKFESVVTTRN